MIPIRDFIFHDGTSYRNLIESIKNHTDELFIRHDVDSHLRYALKFARLEKRCGYKAHYFLFEKDFPQRGKFERLGHETGLHIRAGDTPPHIIPWTIHGEAQLYRRGVEETLNLQGNKSFFPASSCDAYISDSMGLWSCYLDSWGHEFTFWLGTDRLTLLEIMSHIWRRKLKKVHLLIHPYPLRWRPKYGPIRKT